MAAQYLTLLCVSVVFLQTVSSQCIGPIPGIEEYALAASPLNYGPGAIPLQAQVPLANYGAPVISNPYGFVPSSGGTFTVTSSSPIAPTGIRVVSDNAIEGAISILGELPFLGSVAFESALPTAGAGAISYGCGSGIVGIASENVVPAYNGINGGVPMSGARYGFPGPLPAQGVIAPGVNPGFVGPAAFNGMPGYGYGPAY